MKLSTSTGDFNGYVESVADKVRQYKDTKFKYINLEQTREPTVSILSDPGEGWRQLAEDWGEAAVEAGVTYVVSHAPCVDAFEQLTDEHYEVTLRAIRRSIEICHMLGIKRTVVHASSNANFGADEFYQANKRFYADLFDLMEKYDITVMVENMHKRPCYAFSTGAEMRRFLDEVDHPLLAACWDTAHANRNQQAKDLGQYQNIVALGDRLKGLHISDNFGNVGHHHTWPFAGAINFDQVMQGLLDVNYDGYFNFEASYTILHHTDKPYNPYCRKEWEYKGEIVTKLYDPPIEIKKKAVDLLYDIGQYMLETYNCFEE